MKLGNRASQHNFAMIPNADIQRSKFNRSAGRKQTFDADYLVPIFLDEVLPGDTHNVSLNAFARLATPLTPFMDNLYLDYFFFFVPNRLIWNNWQKFNGEQEDPGDSTDFTIPLAEATTLTVASNTLQNYMGIPANTYDMSINKISALPFRAYNLIWNEWFRDQNMQNSIKVDKDNGPDSSTDYVLRKRGKRHDYFTSALPWPQKGPSVELPLGQKAPVFGENYDLSKNLGPTLFQRSNTFIDTLDYDSNSHVVSNNGQTTGKVSLLSKERWEQIQPWNAEDGQLPYADLSQATAATINQIREAFQIQKLYERDARGGTRYIEIIRSHFGVVSPDARLQRPEYLGGGQTQVNINPIAQTSATADQPTPQGNLAAMGTAITRGIGFQKSFVEHGYIIGLVSARADLSYQQGLNRMWTRETRFDFYWPALSHLGEQAILNQEIFAQGTATDLQVFGYQERYAEYRYKPSEILGTFSSNSAQTLDIWHLAQDFSTLPELNGSFIESATPIKRVIAVETEPHFLMDIFVQQTSARPMPTYSVPGYMDHF